LPSKPARPSEPDRDLNIELLSAKPEATVNAPLRDLNSEDLLARPEVIVKALLRDLNSEFFSERPEAEDREPVSALARPLT